MTQKEYKDNVQRSPSQNNFSVSQICLNGHLYKLVCMYVCRRCAFTFVLSGDCFQSTFRILDLLVHFPIGPNEDRKGNYKLNEKIHPNEIDSHINLILPQQRWNQLNLILIRFALPIRQFEESRHGVKD